MTLLLGTDIDIQVENKIRGFVARVGGSVNQLVNYSNCWVEDVNLLDGGFGDVLKSGGQRSFYSMLASCNRFVSQELSYWWYGSSKSRDRKTVVLDLHYGLAEKGMENRYECSISSNMIEHSPNPILLMLNFYFITRKGGFQFHALPHYKYTYDKYRRPTGLEHMVDDFVNRVGMDDETHNKDYIQSAVEKDGWQKEFHDKYPVSYPYMHFHVFDEINVRELYNYMFEEVCNDVIKTESFSDNVVVFENTLNRTFVSEHKDFLIKSGVIMGDITL